MRRRRRRIEGGLNMATLQSRLSALEQTGRTSVPLVVFADADAERRRVALEAEAAGRRVIWWPVPVPPVEVIEQEGNTR